MFQFYEGQYADHPVNVQFTPPGGGLKQDVSIDLITHAESEMPPDTLLHLGLGNEGPVARRALWQLGKLGIHNVAVVEALPYSQVEAAPAALQEFGTQASLAASQHMQELRRQAGAVTDVPNVVGESLGAAPVLWGACGDPTSAGRVAVLHPLGFQGKMGRLNFMSRMALTGMQPGQWDMGSMVAGNKGFSRVTEDLKDSGGDRLNFALSIALAGNFQKLSDHKGQNLRLFANRHDLLLRAKVITRTLAALGDASLEKLVTVIPGSHSTPASRAGARQVQQVMHWMSGESEPYQQAA